MDEMRAAAVSRYVRTKAEEAARNVEIVLQLPPTGSVKNLVHFIYIELSGHPDRPVSKQEFIDFIDELIKHKLIPHTFIPYFNTHQAAVDFRMDVLNAQASLEEDGILTLVNLAGAECYQIKRELPVPENHVPSYQV